MKITATTAAGAIILTQQHTEILAEQTVAGITLGNGRHHLQQTGLADPELSMGQRIPHQQIGKEGA